jgi:hypothetical protein
VTVKKRNDFVQGRFWSRAHLKAPLAPAPLRAGQNSLSIVCGFVNSLGNIFYATVTLQ